MICIKYSFGVFPQYLNKIVLILIFVSNCKKDNPKYIYLKFSRIKNNPLTPSWALKG